MWQIRTKTVILAVCLVLPVVASCPSGTTGIYPAPVFLPSATSLDVPLDTRTSGEQGEFSFSWNFGGEPFSTVWTFDGGTLEANLTTTGAQRLSVVTVTFDNQGAQPELFSGNVVMTDQRGNALREDFIFMVAPAP